MCLTGVDYFSTLGYQPSIAFVAAGLLSPLATLVLVLLTLFGALPMYYRVAELSPHGQGSISMLETLFPRWKGKAVVSACWDSRRRASSSRSRCRRPTPTAHIIENPLVAGVAATIPVARDARAAVRPRRRLPQGLQRSDRLAVVIVVVYLALNAIVVADGAAA